MPTLILSSEHIAAHLESRHIEVIRRDPEDRAAKQKTIIPLHDVDRVVIAGRPSVTVPLLQRFMKLGIPVFFTTQKGRWIGSLSPDDNMNAQRRIRQYEKSRDSELPLHVSRALVAAKIGNSRRVLQRLAAYRTESHHLRHQQVTNELLAMSRKARSAADLDELRGIEGHSAGLYFSRLGRFFPESLPFNGRSRRPPKDPANALLSWTYSIVMGEVDGCIRSHGLDACIGFLHQTTHGTPALSVDLLEPLRAPLCDLLVLNALNHRHFTEQDFRYDDQSGGYFLKEESHPKFFSTYENAMTRRFMPAKGEPHVDFRKVIDHQVLQIIQALEKDQPPTFFHMP